MTQPKLNRFGILMVLCAALAACQTVVVSPIASPSPSPTSAPPTSVPPIRVISHHVSQGPAPGEWRVVGLVQNQGQIPVSQVQLSVILLDATGEVLAEESAGTLMSNLLPGEVGPFSVTIDSASSPAEARVEPQSHVADSSRRADHRRAELVAKLEEFFILGSGELALVGFVTNSESRHVTLDSLGFLGNAPDGSRKLVAVMQFGPNHLAPGESAPFLALAPENPGAVRWTQFHDGLIADPPGSDSLVIRGDPQLHLTAQGAPFVVGALANSGSSAAAGSVMVSLFEGSRLISLWELETPHPLEAGEQLAFTAFGFPGVSLRFDPLDPGAVRVETRVEVYAGTGVTNPIDLSVDVSAFLSGGSTIFIRGTIRNPMEFDVEAATVYAEVRSSAGELVTAGWSVAHSLEPGGSAEFVLDLPIPVGMNATFAEYDLRAIGLKAQP